MSERLSKFLAERGYAPDKYGELTFRCEEDLDRFRDTLGEARELFGDEAFDGCFLIPVERPQTYDRRRITPGRYLPVSTRQR